MNERFPTIDPALARRRFSRAASSYERASRLELEVGTRLLERLDYVRIAPRRILDAGSGPAREARSLSRRYCGAQVIALDFALPMLPRRGPLERWLGRGVMPLCADFRRLPLAAESVELVWCNLALQWASDPLEVFREFERVLAPDGLILFSSLGPDTLKELRTAAGAAKVHEFIDMHDLGDMLVAAGFSAPVMDMEVLVIEYAAGGGLLDDLRASGQTNARVDRRRGLSGRRTLSGALSQFRCVPLRATFEVVYGHGWKRPAPDRGVKTVRVFKRIP
ncbi:MAG TPA: methyltransferase domain-containing protein [Burkholderiales bacterium]|nr:methyltransferase domain-containing protein [Burkholderiales bacterium]